MRVHRENMLEYVTFTLDPSNLPQLTAEEAARIDSAPIDYRDIPQIPAGFWDRHRPANVENKAQVTLRLDQDTNGEEIEFLNGE